MIPDARPQAIQCPTCTRQAEETIAELQAKLHNLQTSIDALTERADDAEALCETLVFFLEAFEPQFYDVLFDEDDRGLWDDVAPCGRSAPAETDD